VLKMGCCCCCDSAELLREADFWPIALKRLAPRGVERRQSLSSRDLWLHLESLDMRPKSPKKNSKDMASLLGPDWLCALPGQSGPQASGCLEPARSRQWPAELPGRRRRPEQLSGSLRAPIVLAMAARRRRQESCEQILVGGRAGEHVEEQSLTERGTCAEPRGPFGWATRCAYERWRQKGAR